MGAFTTRCGLHRARPSGDRPEAGSGGHGRGVKTALIAGGALWERVRELPPLVDAIGNRRESLQQVIEGCLRTKLAVVARDELDQGARAALILGHTVAHALEAATGYSTYRHGEAVGIGLLVALELSEQELGLDPSLREEVADILGRHGLPGSFRGPSVDELLRAAALDKKRRAGRQNLVLLRAAGDVATGCEVSPSALREAIEGGRATRKHADEATGTTTRRRQALVRARRTGWRSFTA